ncbi:MULTISPECIES: HNH endonuclease [Ralstonia]|nr:HNH endonuclease [Ralstonia pickettii]PLT20474.1 hypothetical protein CXP34_01560 [Ralstonia mannitolilytica]
MRTNLENSTQVFRVAHAIGLEPEEVVYRLYRLAGWFQRYGDYGKLKCDFSTLDTFIGNSGFAVALSVVDWLRNHDGVLTLRGFCTVSATRKSLGKEIRKRVLDGSVCAACGATSNLVIDHVVPIVRGGSCDESNLQALCDPCNRAKGRKTMVEFLRDH